MNTAIPSSSPFSRIAHALRLSARGPAFQCVLGAAIVFAAAVSVYLPVLKHDFVGDDFSLIVNNDFLADRGSFSFLLSRDFLRHPYPVKLGARPLALLSLMADHAVWGLDPFGYHLTNILLHGLNSALLFMLVMLFRRKGQPPPPGLESEKPRVFPVALLSGLIFALHPLQAEAVDIASFRADLLSAFFCLLALLAFTRRSYLLSLACFILGLFSKETAVILPLVTLLYAWVFREKRGVRGEAASAGRSRLVLYTLLSGGLALLFLLYFWTERFQYPLHRVIFPALTGGISPVSSFSAYANTICLSFLHYCKALFVPVKLSLEYQLALPGSVFNIRVLLALALAAVSFYGFRASANRMLKFGMGFFFIAYLPVSNLAPLVNTVADRYMYLPLAGFSLFLAALLAGGNGGRLSTAPAAARPTLPPERLRGYPARIKALGPALCLALLCWYGVRTAAECGRFKDMFAVYSAAAAVAPRNPNARYNLALARMERREYSLAAGDFEAVMALAPLYHRVEIWHFLGVCSEKLGDDGKARAFYAKALLVAPDKETFNNLAGLMHRAGKDDSAAWLMMKSLEIAPDPISNNNMGAYYAERKKFSEAIRYFRRAVSLQPGYTEAWLNLLNACEASGDPELLRKETGRMAALFARNKWEIKKYAR